MHEAFVLDTSLLTNPDAYRHFGASTELAIASLIALLKQAEVACYMPRSAYEELIRMKDLGELAGEFELHVKIRSPRKNEIQIPATILYEFIEEVRLRMDRGLRIAEEHARRGIVGESEEVVIHRLRERYREALRRGIIDSREDADVLLLAYELDAAIVSADEGLCTWADKVGVALVAPSVFRQILEHAGRG